MSKLLVEEIREWFLRGALPEEYHDDGGERRFFRDLSDLAIKQLEASARPAALAAIEQALQAIDDEPELPGDMPDEMWASISRDRDACQQAMRIAVRQTKDGIRNRLLNATPGLRQEPEPQPRRNDEEKS